MARRTADIAPVQSSTLEHWERSQHVSLEERRQLRIEARKVSNVAKDVSVIQNELLEQIRSNALSMADLQAELIRRKENCIRTLDIADDLVQEGLQFSLNVTRKAKVILDKMTEEPDAGALREYLEIVTSTQDASSKALKMLRDVHDAYKKIGEQPVITGCEVPVTININNNGDHYDIDDPDKSFKTFKRQRAAITIKGEVQKSES